MSVSFNINDAISPSLRAALAKLKDKRPILKLAAEAVVGIADQAFTNPSMRLAAWPALKKSTSDRKGHGKPLQDTGSLMKSLMANAPQSDQVEFGSSEEYARAQNFGYKQIPARLFIPIAANGTALPSNLACRK